MKKFFKRYSWTILIVLASLGLAGSAAYFSISGLSKLFAGSAFQIIIMASFIELAKIVTTAGLHRYWKATNWMLKTVLTFMIVIIMGITSSGIYGFLADAYSSTAIELEKMKGQIELVEKKQEQKREIIVGINETKEMKSNRINSLVELRTQQENRVDSLQKKGWSSSAKRVEKSIAKADEDINRLQIEIDSLIVKTNRVNEEIGLLDIEVLDLENSDVATEIGPLKYMASVVGSPMETIINWFILALIFVFDPLAVLLIIFANVVYDKASEDSEPEKEINALEDAKTPNDGLDDEDLEEAIRESEFYEEMEEMDNDIVVEEESKENHEESYQKIVDSINNTDPNILEYSYDIPKVEAEKVVEYIEGEDGEFSKSNKNIMSTLTGIDSNPVYLKLLDVLFLDGTRKIGDIIPSYIELSKYISDKGIECEDKVIKNFLTICNLLDITNMSNKNKVTIMKSYVDSKNLISMVSK